jgi:hypothetical protein
MIYPRRRTGTIMNRELFRTLKAIQSPYKAYVGVTSYTDAEANITPLFVVWEDGRKYEIDEVLDMRHVAGGGGIGMRYTIRIGSRTTYLWHEDDVDAWYVERK